MKKNKTELARQNLDSYFRSRKAPGPLTVKTGETVAYTRYWLLAVGTRPTDDLWRRRGTVVDVERDVALVRWNDGTEARVLTSNLAHVGANSRFCD